MIIAAIPCEIRGSLISKTLRDNALQSLSTVPKMEILQWPSQSDSLTKRIRDAGHALQDRLGLDGYFWNNDAESNTLACIWPPYSVDGLPCALDKYCDMRGDEIVFQSLDSTQHISWAFGHARGFLHWSLTVLHAEKIVDQWPQLYDQKSETAVLIWWAQRINLKVYSAE